MSRQIGLVLSLLILVVIPIQAKEKNRAWQTGKVLDSDRASTYAGTVITGLETGTAIGVPVNKVHQTYVIDLGDIVYVARQHLRWKWSKSAELTVNGTVKVAIEKSKLYLIGEDGKEYEADIVKKSLKPTKETP